MKFVFDIEALQGSRCETLGPGGSEVSAKRSEFRRSESAAGLLVQAFCRPAHLNAESWFKFTVTDITECHAGGHGSFNFFSLNLKFTGRT